MNIAPPVIPLGIIKNRFGSKKGLLKHLFYNIFFTLGFYKKLSHINLTHVKRLVFVCKGNICRSALAEAVINNAFPVTSFGLSTAGNASADQRAAHIAVQLGLDLTDHKTRKREDYKPIAGDLLVAMEPIQASELQKHFKTKPVQITLLGLWQKNKSPYIHDPYNTNSVYFEKCELLVAACTQNLLQAIQKTHEKNR